MRKKLRPCRILNKNTAPDRSKSHQTFQSLFNQTACTYKYRRKGKRNISKVNVIITFGTTLNLARFIKKIKKKLCEMLWWCG
jgi:hypothetical protein